MSKEKNAKEKSVKKAPLKSKKEKRADKIAKRNDKGKIGGIIGL
ncbi:MAG: hypothetical protein PHG98_05035 [Bacteroidales bacterium]|jgi:hypothetical protein|nr:hypothetical protein [Bacteroidales bacterium]MDD4739299.1 hypothetical protein [Bacteroidales bacterium]MDY4789933.1 hypothetical protein [Bacteroidales bacterium]